MTFSYRFTSEDAAGVRLRLKVEINSREHFSVYRLKAVPFSVASRWFEGSCGIQTYELDELLGTKLRGALPAQVGAGSFRPRGRAEGPEGGPSANRQGVLSLQWTTKATR